MLRSVYNKILVATSISPKDLTKQKEAIATWLKSGLVVVSLNSKEEQHVIKPFFPEITFHTVTRTAQAIYGKPYVYIHDILQYLGKSNHPICGIINSDIHLKYVNKDFRSFLMKEAADGLVYGHRLEVQKIGDKQGHVCNGVDYFFFDRKLALSYKDDGLCLGQPAWDWWMVCVPASLHIATKRLFNQIAFHETHPQTWDQELNATLTDNIVIGKYIKKLYPDLPYNELKKKMWDIVIAEQGITYTKPEAVKQQIR